MENESSKPAQHSIRKYGYGMVDTPDRFNVVNPQYIQKVQAVILDGKLAIKQYLEPILSVPDELYNYSLQLCHWYLQLLELSDTAKEGDMNRLILNCKYNLPFFIHTPN